MSLLIFSLPPPPLYEWPNSGHVPKVAVHWAGGGGSAKEKKGLLVEIVETFSLSVAHER